MRLKIPPNPDGLPYLEIDFIEGRLGTRRIGKEDKDRLVPDHRDAHFDMTDGKWSIRMENGGRKGYPDPFPFGAIEWEFIVMILLAASEYMYPRSTKDVYSMFYRIQKAFGKPPEKRQRKNERKQPQRGKKKENGASKSTFWFQPERKPTYRVKLNPARSYRIITNANLDGLNYAIGNQ